MSKTTCKEEIFGGVSDCKGMGTISGDGCSKIPEEAKTRTPRYHEGEQAEPVSVEPEQGPVAEAELSSHF